MFVYESRTSKMKFFFDVKEFFFMNFDVKNECEKEF